MKKRYLSLSFLLSGIFFGPFFTNCSQGNIEEVNLQASVERGRALYGEYCLSCHQADGTGVPGLYPPVTPNEWISGEKHRLIRLMIEGLSGPIEVNGEPYSFEMAAHDFLSDQEIADILTFLRSSFGNSSEPVTSEDVSIVRKSLTEEISSTP
jgi:mono/diheme cytochrome c family protein